MCADKLVNSNSTDCWENEKMSQMFVIFKSVLSSLNTILPSDIIQHEVIVSYTNYLSFKLIIITRLFINITNIVYI